jgi:hypothetical protein
MKLHIQKTKALILTAAAAAVLLNGCGGSDGSLGTDGSSDIRNSSGTISSMKTADTHASPEASGGGEKVLTIGSGQAPLPGWTRW